MSIKILCQDGLRSLEKPLLIINKLFVIICNFSCKSYEIVEIVDKLNNIIYSWRRATTLSGMSILIFRNIHPPSNPHKNLPRLFCVDNIFKVVLNEFRRNLNFKRL